MSESNSLWATKTISMVIYRASMLIYLWSQCFLNGKKIVGAKELNSLAPTISANFDNFFQVWSSDHFLFIWCGSGFYGGSDTDPGTIMPVPQPWCL